MKSVRAPRSPGRKITQKRGQKTYDALIATGFKLLETQEFESLTVAELTQAAGYSVGAFYARFRSKDEFFDALIAQHIEHRTQARNRIFATASNRTLINELMEELVPYYWKRRRFWRAALIRSTRDPEFWGPVRQHGHGFGNALIERITKQSGRKLSKTEETSVRFAIQVAFGTINNTIMNRPGPVFLGQRLFIENLVRAFRLVSDYDRLVRIKKARSPA